MRALAAQSFTDFETIIIDNSGEGRVSRLASLQHIRRIENKTNLGFGAALNQGIRESESPFVAVLNDDTVPHPACLQAMLTATEARYEIGMCAPQIRILGDDLLDSAGMLVARDGSSKQRGHREPVSLFARPQQALFPSGCAALYRRDMLDEVGLFDERFFLYCEDTDLGLRARWKLWECVYVPEAVVEHRYSHSSGSASEMKAFYVERNRLFVVIKNFPAPDMLLAPVFGAVRFFWHIWYAGSGRGKAAEYRRAGGPSLAVVALRAWAAVVPHLMPLWSERRRIQKTGRMAPKQFRRLLASNRISERQVAAL